MSEECKLWTPVLLFLVTTLYIGCWLVIATLEWRIHNSGNENQDFISFPLSGMTIKSTKMVHDNRLLELDDNNFKSVVDFAASYKNKLKRKVRRSVGTTAPANGSGETTPASGTETNAVTTPESDNGETTPVSGTETNAITTTKSDNEETTLEGGYSETTPGGGYSETTPGGGYSEMTPVSGSDNDGTKFDNALELVGNHSDIVFDNLTKVLDLEMKAHNITNRVKELLWSKISKRSIKEDAEELANKIKEALLSPEMKKDIEAALLKMAQEMDMLKNNSK